MTRLQDLAALAGCSTATVSRALRDDPRINVETRTRIWQLAYDVDYPLAKYLGGRSGAPASSSLSIVIPRRPSRTVSLREPFLLELLAQIGDEARFHEIDLRLTHFAPSNEVELNEFFDSVVGDPVIVLGQGLLHEALNEVAKRRRNMVVWGARQEEQNYCSVGTDNYAGGLRATPHLISQGRRNLVFLGDIIGPEMTQRYRGFCEATAAAGVSATLVRSRLDVNVAARAIQGHLARGTRFDGIVAVNDVSAIGAINVLIRSGLSIPDDVSIVGYDDIQHCHYVRPMLSTVSQNVTGSARSSPRRCWAT
ncbi:LacI family DNA-binding transcriptional regulator [Sphingomonas sp. VNH70]|uniref:LacI family DNA-binding transcriptional regulator n=1 Tax=Sphingomonas silueang TaxID=3156617 RepID=UPI0032B39FA7